MAELAEHIGLPIPFILCIPFPKPFLNGLNGRIHVAVNIQVGKIRRIAFQNIMLRFVMGQAGAVHALDIGQLCFGVGTVTRLVAHRPYHDGRVVFIAGIQQSGPIHKGLPESLVVGHLREAGILAILVDGAMAFLIRLVNHIEAVPIAQLDKNGGVRIMRGADGVDIVLLHQGQIPHHMLLRNGGAVKRAAIVAIDSAELHALPV